MGSRLAQVLIGMGACAKAVAVWTWDEVAAKLSRLKGDQIERLNNLSCDRSFSLGDDRSRFDRDR
ncbi:MAG: hypothetical protein HQL39_15485 [Alphaproteobacteria bacterium]|nr:hypothetical protein [Alphaproteobacteria bacterium]